MNVALPNSARLLTACLLGLLLAGACWRAAPLAAQPAQPPADNLPPPPGLAAEEVAPRRGPALERARLTLEAIRPGLPQPAFLHALTPAARAQATREPELPAQRAYLAALTALEQGQGFVALRHLRLAAGLAPDSAPILARLGSLLVQTGSPAAGLPYLERALALQPDDPRVAFDYARLHLQHGQWSPAAATLLHVLDLLERPDAPAAPNPWVVRHALGQALLMGGHDAAGGRLVQAFLDHSMAQDADGLADLQLTPEQRGQLALLIGDTRMRLGEPAQAMEAYQQAAAHLPADSPQLVSRLLYAHLRLGQARPAEDLVLDLFARPQAMLPRQALARYLVEHGGSAGSLVPRLETHYRQGDRPTELALTVAELLPPDRRAAFLAEHLAAAPSDRPAFEAFLRAALVGDGGLAQALPPALQAMAQLPPEQLDGRASLLLRLAGDPPAVRAALAALPPEQAQTPQAVYLDALVLLRLGQAEPGRQRLARLLEAHPDFDPARLLLARELLQAGLTAEADRLLERLDGQDPRVLSLRIDALTRSGLNAQALLLLDQLIAQQPDNLDLILRKAALLLGPVSNPKAAERVLLDALNDHPTAEPLYEALVDLYNQESVQTALDDPMGQYQRLVQRMLGVIPDSPVARVQLATFHVAQRRFAEAEELAAGVLEERPNHLGALEVMLEVLRHAGGGERAQALLQPRLEAAPGDVRLFKLAEDFFEQVGDQQRLDQVRLRFLEQQAFSLERNLMMAAIHQRRRQFDQARQLLEEALAQGPAERAAEVLSQLGLVLMEQGRSQAMDEHFRQALARHPHLDADLRLRWAELYLLHEQPERSEPILLELLDRHPRHAAAGNTLGYIWADQGRNLPRARELIESAVAMEPSRPEYLDSLGWVEYKQGQFAQAAEQLTKAVDLARRQAAAGGSLHAVIVILDHLGDALYHTDRPRAQRHWAEALRLIQQARARPGPAALVSELGRIEQQLLRKLDALEKGLPAPVAEVPAGPAAK